MKHFPPPYSSAAQFEQQLQDLGHTVIAPESLTHWLHCQTGDLRGLQQYWNDLPPDAYLRDGGRYRFRRHASFVVDSQADPAVRAMVAVILATEASIAPSRDIMGWL